MPPIGSNVLDQESIALLQQWIAELPARKSYAQWRAENFGSSSSVDGEKTANPDGDEYDNESEFLADTNPLNGAAFPATTLVLGGTGVSVAIEAPEHRIVTIEQSEDLVSWSRWDVPGNNALSGTAGVRIFTGEAADAAQFFRPVMRED
jgi:hypothetical protein